MTDYAIDVAGLTKVYNGRAVVDGITLRVPRGKIFGFLGPNGSGKTTTIRMLCGLLTPEKGGGSCLGFDLRTQAAMIKRRTGYMTQKFSYWEDLTVRENLDFVATVFDLENAKKKVDQALENMQLTAREHQLVGTLSGGWKQRFSLSAAILHDPELLLLDEPTSGVDPKARREFWNEIHHLAEHGMTVLVSTHYMDEAERCHEIIYMAEGGIITQGPVADVIAGAKLTTWLVKGPRLAHLMDDLKKHPAVTSAAPFGDSLHISGTDAAGLENAIAPYRGDKSLLWSHDKPTMEDVFFHYTARRHA